MAWETPRVGGHWAQRQREFKDLPPQKPATDLLLEQDRSNRWLLGLPEPTPMPVVKTMQNKPIKKRKEKEHKEKPLTKMQQSAILKNLLIAGEFEEWRKKKEEFWGLPLKNKKHSKFKPQIQTKEEHFTEQRPVTSTRLRRNKNPEFLKQQALARTRV